MISLFDLGTCTKAEPGVDLPRRPRAIRGEAMAGAELATLRAALAAQTRVAEEYAHRNRNLLGLVASLGRRTLDGAADLPEARAEFEAMIARLAAGQEAAALAPGRREAAAPEARDLRGLAAAVLGGFESAAGHVTLDGPPVALARPAGRLLALVLFELATNALKHGVLGRSEGRLRIAWSLAAAGDLRLLWSEEMPEGYRVRGRRRRPSGGGTALFAALGQDLGGAFTRLRTPTGFAAEIMLPARHLRPAAVPVDARLQAPAPDAGRAAPEPFGPAPDPAAAADVGLPRRVLVVEDSPLIAADLVEIVRAQGVAEVTSALSAAEALGALADAAPEGFDMVLLDVGLGDASAETLIPSLGSARVLLVSGRSREALPHALCHLPLLQKPFQPSQVDAALRGADPQDQAGSRQSM